VLELSSFNLGNDFGILLPFSSIENMQAPLQASKKGISEFVGLKECLTMITLKNPAENTPTGNHEKGSVPIFKKSGKLNVTPQIFSNMIEVANPDFYTTLADGDTWLNCPNKRVIKALDRSESMLDECMNISCQPHPPVLASVQGAFNEFDRKKFVSYLKKYEEKIFGYFIDGLHRNGHEATLIDQQELEKIVKSTISLLPEEKMKIMLGAYLPHVTLKLIANGIDIVDSSFIQIVTNLNRALVFNFDLDSDVRRFPEIDLLDAR
jgi:queuine tRNA-ribosyltransferase accessory subunit